MLPFVFRVGPDVDELRSFSDKALHVLSRNFGRHLLLLSSRYSTQQLITLMSRTKDWGTNFSPSLIVGMVKPY